MIKAVTMSDCYLNTTTLFFFFYYTQLEDTLTGFHCIRQRTTTAGINPSHRTKERHITTNKRRIHHKYNLRQLTSTQHSEHGAFQQTTAASTRTLCCNRTKGWCLSATSFSVQLGPFSLLLNFGSSLTTVTPLFLIAFYP